MAKKILIVYENTGAGHKRVADIFAAALGDQRQYTLIAVAASEFFDDPTIQFVNRVWDQLLRRNWIRLADGFVNFFLRLWVAPLAEVSATDQYLARLDALQPDAIICTCDAFGKVLGTYAKVRAIPFYLVITDIAIFTDLVNPTALHLCYFPETIDAIRSFDWQKSYFAQQLAHVSLAAKSRYVLNMISDYALFRGRQAIFRNIDVAHPTRNQARAVAVGPLVEAAYYVHHDPQAMRKKHGIDSNTPCLLVLSGSIGGAFITEIVHSFQHQVTAPLTIIAVCGRDQRALAAIQGQRQSNSSLTIVPLPFVDYLAELYAAADVVIARPSAGVLLEALVSRTPIITANRATANDLGGIALLQRYQVGASYRSIAQVPQLVQQVLQQKEQYIANIEQLLAPYPKNFDEVAATIQQLIVA